MSDSEKKIGKKNRRVIRKFLNLRFFKEKKKVEIVNFNVNLVRIDMKGKKKSFSRSYSGVC